MSPYVDSPSSQTSALNTSMKNNSFMDHQQPQTPLYAQQQHQLNQQQQLVKRSQIAPTQAENSSVFNDLNS